MSASFTPAPGGQKGRRIRWFRDVKRRGAGPGPEESGAARRRPAPGKRGDGVALARPTAGCHPPTPPAPCGDAALPTPAAEQPSGRINKTAFKLFKRRKSGGTMPSIFGVRSKGGEGKGAGKAAGMVRSRTHDGLADAVLESGKKEEPGGGGGGGGDPQSAEPQGRAGGGPGLSPGSAVAKSHSFFSLLRKNGRAESGKAEGAEQRAGGRQKKGLKGIFSSMRWHKKDKNGKEERGETSEIQAGLIMPGSLTASLECIKEETPKPLCETPSGAGDVGPEAPREKGSGEARASAPEPQAGGGETRDSAVPPGEDPAAGRRPEEPSREPPEPGAGGEVGTAKDAAITGDVPIPTIPPVEPHCDSGQETAAAPDPSSVDPPSEQSIDRICLMFADVTSLKSFDSLTGCGDIIADHEEDVGSGSGGCAKSAPGAGKLGASKKHPTMVAYQGGGEEMASPDQVDDTYLQEFWDMLSQTEETQAEAGGGGGGAKKPEGLKENRGTEGAQNRVAVKRGGLHQIPIHLNHKEEQKSREKDQHEGVPNSDEGYWDSTTPGPEEDGSTSIQKETIPRDSYSGDALYDLYTEPDETPPAAPADEGVTCVPRSKPVSPITTTCSLKTPSSTLRDSKIPISIKHLSSHPASHGADSSNSHHVAHHHLAKSEMHRTKIPVSKVLVRRVSNRGLAGTTVKAATYQDSAKK
ncbi:PREDICTED: APC membrane recruitment protein 2 [Calidris pugnax]|uniref:APC membrane recruitment protein 2 n=1 Tax=Calidris pugnax TaxID=198806 RepID=UPI00071CE8AA|nr:PREDICTED: APC membrane recruitment protein 2 [Calidris pugnax]